MKIFVYGTLRPMGRNHSLLRTLDATFVAKGTVRGTLYVADGLPMLGSEPGVVHGEVYEVKDAFLPVLDNFEGHPTWYVRQITSVTAEDGKELQASAYWMPYTRLYEQKNRVLITSGDYISWWNRNRKEPSNAPIQ